MFLASDPLSHVKDLFLVPSDAAVPVTMHMVTLVVVSVVLVLALMHAAKRIAVGPESQGHDRYLTRGRFPQLIETIVVYLRDEMLVPVMGKQDARRYLPFLMTVFFFILFNNVFGLIPLLDFQHALGEITGAHFTTYIGGTATGNLAVTAALATVAGVVIQFHGIRELGLKGWAVHHFGGLVPGPIYLLPVALLVFVVELMGDIIKPVALAIRLFANMLAGHTLLAVLLGFGAMAIQGGMGMLGVGGVVAVSGVGALAITFLEIFVAFLQAFIFMFLTAVFISLMSHHSEEEHEHEDIAAHGEHEQGPGADDVEGADPIAPGPAPAAA